MSRAARCLRVGLQMGNAASRAAQCLRVGNVASRAARCPVSNLQVGNVTYIQHGSMDRPDWGKD